MVVKIAARISQRYSAGLRAGWMRIRVPAGELGIFLFTTASRQALGPTQPPMQWGPEALSLGTKRPGREADHSPPSSAEIKECVELYLHSPNKPSWRGAQLKHRNNFTVVKIQVEVSWVLKTCGIVVRYRRFGGPCCLQLRSECRQQGSPKRRYPATTLHSVTSQVRSPRLDCCLPILHSVHWSWQEL
jgi:hypothetical protein